MPEYKILLEMNYFYNGDNVLSKIKNLIINIFKH